MRKNKPIDIPKFQQQLLSWYRKNARDLPWRRTEDPYRIWLSEVMLQQTQVKTVIPYYHKFLTRFPTVRELAIADLQKVLKMWEGLGYYSRARNLHKAANIIVDQHDEIFPTDLTKIKNLPGIGDYIAAAVGSIAFQHSVAVVDGNVKRVLARLLCMPEPVNNTKHKKIFRKKATTLLNPKEPGDHNEAMMELGALICRPGNPDCKRCPVQQFCQAFNTEQTAHFPKRKKKPKPPLYHISIGVIYKNGKMLITKRKDNGLLGGLWEFPGGKRKTGETAEAACLREIEEETGLTVSIKKHLKKVKHAYTHFRISIDVYICEYIAGEVVLDGPVDFRWIDRSAIKNYPFPKSNHKFMSLLS